MLLRYGSSTYTSSPVTGGKFESEDRKISDLVDTAAQFSRVRSDVMYYLYHIGERCTFLHFLVTFIS